MIEELVGWEDSIRVEETRLAIQSSHCVVSSCLASYLVSQNAGKRTIVHDFRLH